MHVKPITVFRKAFLMSYIASALNYEMMLSGNKLHFVICFSTPLVQGDHGNHHVNLKQEKVTSSVKVQCIVNVFFHV